MVAYFSLFVLVPLLVSLSAACTMFFGGLCKCIARNKLLWSKCWLVLHKLL